jgi:hypothetical protein
MPSAGSGPGIFSGFSFSCFAQDVTDPLSFFFADEEVPVFQVFVFTLDGDGLDVFLWYVPVDFL